MATRHRRSQVIDEHLPAIIEIARRGSTFQIKDAIDALVDRGRLDEAFALAVELCQRGFDDAAGALAQALYADDGPRPDPKRWLALMTRHARSGSPGAIRAMYELGLWFEKGGEHEEARKWYTASADAGFPEARKRLTGEDADDVGWTLYYKNEAAALSARDALMTKEPPEIVQGQDLPTGFETWH